MKKQSLKKWLWVLIAIVLVTACKQKEKSEYTVSAEEQETLAVVLKPIHAKLPIDAKPTCVVSDTDFKSWFKDGSITKNGIVNPANSVTFSHLNNCDFYKWSEQMFLWMMSPITEGSYSNGTVMESPAFFTVSPKVNGKRTLIPHEKGKLISVVANAQKNDPRVDTEEGQATDDVLMSQKKSLVYYISMVNDVYAQFLTGAKNDSLSGNEFPTTKGAMDSIVSYAKNQGVTLKNPETLAIEIKTSWVDASSVSNPSEYISIDAIVPVYNKTDHLWVPKPDTTATAKLVMIGAHVVGSTAGHPEMVWATFEHKDNTPNLSYKYVDTTGTTKTIPADTGNDWLLNGDSSSATYNVSHMTFSNDSIIAKTGQTISPSNTKMTKPWGVADNVKPNPENATPADSNTQVISINNSVLGWLTDDDMRKNYLFIGATWTDGGVAPNGESYSDTNTTPGVAIGTGQLANSTMETYFQHGSAYTAKSSCFTCHSGYPTPGLKPIDLSHIYDAIQPLVE